MSVDFGAIFEAALKAGVTAAKPGGKAAEDWIRESAKANEKSLKAIAEGVRDKKISSETGSMLLRESNRALDSEAAALTVILKAAAQAAVNAFFDSLKSALTAALKIAL